jgi:GTP-binding protein Era
MSDTNTPLIDQFNQQFKAGYVAVIGYPNAGKSTLLNHILGQKLSIVTDKPQTTRKNVLGILNAPDYQIVFIDTPGLLDPRYNLQKMMMKFARNAIRDADIIVFVQDVSVKKHNPEEVAEILGDTKGKPVILALNKIDLLKDRKEVLPLIEVYKAAYPFKSIVPISAEYNDGIADLLQEMINLLPFSPPFYPSDYITDQQERFFVAEIIREKIFKLYSKEIPYATHVEIEEFEEKEHGKDYIRAVIYVERSTQKQILIGKNGSALKRVGTYARQDIERFLGRPVFLELFVKVSPDWRKKDSLLKQLGYRP